MIGVPRGNGNGHSYGQQRFPDSQTYFAELARILDRISHVGLDEILAALVGAYERDSTVYIFGNGGSAALAQHFACDLAKGTMVPGMRRVRAVSLADNIPLLTAWANDSAYDDVFAEQLRNLIRPGDVAFAVSGSGNSPNVLRALHVARECQAVTIGIGGFEGGKMIGVCDLCVVVPSDFMQLIEDVHLAIAHSLSLALRARIVQSVGAQKAAKATAPSD